MVHAALDQNGRTISSPTTSNLLTAGTHTNLTCIRLFTHTADSDYCLSLVIQLSSSFAGAAWLWRQVRVVMEITSDRDRHTVVIRRSTLNIGFCNRQQASTTHEVNFKMGRMFSWKAIISFRRESNAVVMHGGRRRHETLGVARTAGRPDDNLFVRDDTSYSRTAVTRRMWWRLRDDFVAQLVPGIAHWTLGGRTGRLTAAGRHGGRRTVLLTSLPTARLWLHCAIVNWTTTRDNSIIHGRDTLRPHSRLAQPTTSQQ